MKKQFFTSVELLNSWSVVGQVIESKRNR